MAALPFFISMNKKNIYLIGYMGTGKSTLGKTIAKKIDGMVLREMDEMIVEREGRSISDIFATDGEEYFRRVETDLLREIAKGDNQVISCGGGVPLREENIDIMKESGIVVWLTASAYHIYQRVKNDTARPLLKDKMTQEYISQMMDAREPFYSKAADYRIETGRNTRSGVISEMMKIIDKL